MKLKLLLAALLHVLYIYANEAFSQAAKSRLSFKAQKLITLSEGFIKRNEYDSASFRLKEALQLSIKADSHYDMAVAYDKLADLSQSMGKSNEMNKFDSLAFPVVRQLKDSSLLVNIYNRKGIYAIERGKNHDADIFFKTALALGLQKQASEKTGEVYSNLGSMYLAKGEKDKALENFLKALTLFERNNAEQGMGETYSNISSLFYLLGKVDDAIQYQQKSITIRKKLDDKKGLAVTNINIGQLYILKGSLELALNHLQQALRYAEQVKNPKLIASAYSALSVYYSKTKNYSEALSWQTKGIALFEEINDKQMLSRLYVSAGNLASVANDSLKSVLYYKKGLNLARSLDNKENIANAYEKLSAFYFARNHFEQAHLYYKQFITYRDSISEKSNLAKITEIRTLYETEKKDGEISRLNVLQKLKQLQIEKQNVIIAGNVLEAKQKQAEIELLSTEKQLKDDALEKQNLLTKNREQQLALSEKEALLMDTQLLNQKIVRNLLLTGLVLTLVTGLTWLNRFKLKRKIQQQADLLAIRNSISKNLHDEIGSTLTSINILSNVSQKTLLNNPVHAGEMLGKISTQSKTVQEKMSDIVWAIRPENEKMESLVARIREYASQTLEVLDIDIKIALGDELIDQELPIQARKELLLICKEAISNIARHAGASTVTMEFVRHNEALQLEIKDNGKWKGGGTGTGTKSMRDRAQQLGGDLSVVPGDSGTLVHLLIPLT
ncbi:tetratricopeptide repeat-containing sensor histidine kinase [Dyadobacter psychrotolerans]|uniref:Tetratricopeptide repeat-containing sensor histidine kinase n=1 Tax=Dyadobacter psychrotolerans TaxID=2541721 RepID=A0A4V2Z400_9BACT|nr:tetratricopeptide repeat-containing sensor histidine kinase [Dyadobacter psychrotolerans]TDE14638.1 tetratricopeptide repeat-containing sensor histidine kinase [Dyadobacter psychrotolerans]